MYIAWGPEFIQLLDDAYLPILGAKHPNALGLSTTVTFAEIWEVIGPMFRRVISAAEPTNATDQVLFLDRSGYTEECYFTFSYSPVPDDEAGVTGGVFVTALETTDKVIDERRLRTLGDLASKCSQAKKEELVLPLAAEALQTNPHDMPFALLYRCDPERPAEPKVAGQAGISVGENDFFSDPRMWMLGDDLSQEGVLLIHRLNERVPSLPTGIWTIAPNQAAVVPISLPGDTAPGGYLLCGLNPHKKFDQKYKAFLTRVADLISISLADARAFDEQRKRSEALAQIDRAKTTFFTNVSHEFRTPLTLMLGPLQEVLDRHTDPKDPFAEEIQQLSMVHRNGVRLLKLVNALLDFSLIEAGRDTAKYEPLDLSAYTADLASLFRSATEKAGLELIVDCRPLRQIAFVDREMWEKIVLNLISNAFKFTLQGSITVRIYENAGAAVLEISDTGVGIPEEHVLRIFDRFHRVEGTAGRTIEGTGIGLALVQELVKLHKGSIDVKTRVGLGTTFTVSIPLEQRTGDAVDVDAMPGQEQPKHRVAHGYVDEAIRWLPEEAANETFDAPGAGRERILEGSRILIADDNADMREYLHRLLKGSYDVETVSNGAQALDAIYRRKPDLVLSDVMMPVMDGMALLRSIREDPSTASLPVILLSARAGEESQVEGLDTGADDYLIKPFSARELMARVSAALKIAQLRATSESLVREERARLLEVLQQAPAFFALLQGPDHVISLVNPLYLRLINNRDVIGQPVRIALPDAAEQGYIEILDGVFKGQPYVGLGSRYDVFAGEGIPPDQRYVDFIYQPLREANGNVSGIIVLGVDVTDRKIAQDALLRSEKLATAGILASSIAHEINNPLEAVTNLLFLARNAAVGPIATEFLEAADNELRRVAAVVTKTLRFHRQYSKPLPVHIDPLIDSTFSLYQSRIAQAGIAVERRSRTTLAVTCLDGEIRQVLNNLVGNAIDALKTQGGRLLFRSRSATHWTTGRRGVLLTVADTGPGISGRNLSKIFEPFFSTKGDQGTGLGLWISKEIIERHRGILRVKSREGKTYSGTVFTLFLPSD